MINLVLGDCLEKMKDIPDGSVDMVLTDIKVKLAIVEEYKNTEKTLRDLAQEYKTDHHRIKRILSEFGIKILRKEPKPFTQEHRRKIGERSKGRRTNLGKKMPKGSLYKNMVAHLRFKVDLSWIEQFSDIEKLKCLNNMVTNRGRSVINSSRMYIDYIERFYFDKNFNIIYARWVTNKNHLLKPTIDHIIPKCRGGENTLSNYQILSWFENRCKNNMSQSDWTVLKNNIKDYIL